MRFGGLAHRLERGPQARGRIVPRLEAGTHSHLVIGDGALGEPVDQPRARCSSASGPSPTFPDWLLAAALAGASAALLGGFWDDAWHTNRGRDSFFIAPHLLIYGGVAAIGAALAAHVAAVLRRRGGGAIRRDRPLLLAQVRERSILHAVVGALVIAAAVFPVAEYDTDVPQFATVWYLPVLTAGVTLAFELCRRTSTTPWARTEAAAMHLAAMGVVSAFLVAVGFPAPGVTLTLAGALAADLAERARVPRPGQAALLALSLSAAYVPVRTYLGHGVHFDAAGTRVGPVETWLPIAAVDGAQLVTDGHRFAYRPRRSPGTIYREARRRHGHLCRDRRSASPHLRALAAKPREGTDGA